jgi:hypothetical protein
MEMGVPHLVMSKKLGPAQLMSHTHAVLYRAQKLT